MVSDAAQSSNAKKVQGWIEGLTPKQEIACDYWPCADGSDPILPSWALMDIDRRRVVGFIDQNAPGPDNHSEISNLLEREEEAGRIVSVACGFYRHPARAEADRQNAAKLAAFYEARGPADDMIDALAVLAETLHAVDPTQSVAAHRRHLGDLVRSRLYAWDEPEDDPADDVPF